MLDSVENAEVDRSELLERRIPRLLREHRRRAGLTLKDVGGTLGTTPQTVQRLETGEMTMSLAWLDKLMAALNLKPSDLFQTDTLDQLAVKATKIARQRVAQDLRGYADRVESGEGI